MGPGRRRQYKRERTAKQRESRRFLERNRIPDDLPSLLALHRRALGTDPGDLSSRFLLANCLYASGEHALAEEEWDVVAGGGDNWAELVAETRQCRKPSEGAA